MADAGNHRVGWRVRIAVVNDLYESGSVEPNTDSPERLPDRNSDELWAFLTEHVDRVAELLTSEGWAVVDGRSFDDPTYWFLVYRHLERAGETIELELRDNGDLLVYPVDDVERDEPTEPVVQLSNPDLELCRAEFVAHGWLRRV